MAATPDTPARRKKAAKPVAAEPEPASPAADKRRAKAERAKAARAQKRLDADREAFYQANKERIDKALARCVKHFKHSEPDIVKAVSRMLPGYYTRYRMKLPTSQFSYGVFG